MDSEMSDQGGCEMDNAFSPIPSRHHKWQSRALCFAVLTLLLILPTTALAQPDETVPLHLPPIPPYFTVVNGWLQADVDDARRAQVANQNTLNACLALLDKARNSQNATAVAAAQRAVNTAEEVLRKNRIREQRALKALSWVERLRREGNSSGKVSGFMPRIERSVEIQSASGGATRPVTGDTPPILRPGDTLRTGNDGRADVLLEGGGLLSLYAGSALTLAEGGALAFVRGEVLCRVKRMFEVRTPDVAVGVRGTEFALREISGKPASATVIVGTVAFNALKGTKTILVGAGKQSRLLPDGTSSETAKANLQEMKKWWEE
jgi:hypothetical protein